MWELHRKPFCTYKKYATIKCAITAIVEKD